MELFFIRMLIFLVVALLVTTVVLRVLFKGSLLFKLIILWAITIIFTVINTRFTSTFPDIYPQAISLPTGLVVVLVCIFIAVKLVRNPLTTIIKSLEILSEGNLRTHLDDEARNRNDELGSIANSIFKLSETYSRLVSEIKQSAKEIELAGDQFIHTSETLSQGANLQAASVEEISATIEEISSNILQASDGAGETDKIAASVNEKIKRMGQEAKKSLDAVQTIDGKIKVITDIAFQTNILALNAAVEAARAGEHGKGFAVVAAEVRKLAENSKKAAEEIISIAQNAVSITQNTSNLLISLVPEMDKTSMLVMGIYNSNQEQTHGASQVNHAITELNKITQQNAASAENMHSSALLLERKSKNLKELLQIFKE